MKTGVTKASASAFAMTFTSANKGEYPVLYSEDSWHTAKSGSSVCEVYDNVNSKNTSSTGAQFTQEEINETFAKAINEKSDVQDEISRLWGRVQELDKNVIGVYHFCGTVDSKENLPTTASSGDVYNVSSTGMNYAYVVAPEQIHLSSYSTITGQELLSLYNSIFQQGNKPIYTLHVKGEDWKCQIGATSGERLYAFKVSGGGSGSGTSSQDFVDLSSYDYTQKQYTKASSSVNHLQITRTWDSLGSTTAGVGFLWEDE